MGHSEVSPSFAEVFPHRVVSLTLLYSAFTTGGEKRGGKAQERVQRSKNSGGKPDMLVQEIPPDKNVFLA